MRRIAPPVVVHPHPDWSTTDRIDFQVGAGDHRFLLEAVTVSGKCNAERKADKLLETIIPRNIRLAEAPSYGKPALLYDVRSRGAESYIRLAKEIMERRIQQQAVKIDKLSAS